MATKFQDLINQEKKIQLAEYKTILDQSKGQIIFYGPPGTGKTHIAKQLANLITRAPLDGWTPSSDRKIVQFHPSYSYEDFVQGIKPVKKGSELDYQIKPGIFQKFCQPSESSKVLIIDEINRGNLSKIFGELIYGLEYRNEEIDLQYKEFDETSSFGTLTVPPKEKLMIIGTMNTADRSIILFDAALRRRFSFIPLFPNYDLLAQSLDIDSIYDKDVFTSKLSSANGEEKNKILSILALEKINSELANDTSIGREKQIGHTFLLELQEHPGNFEKVWKRDILPLLEEYYFETPGRIETMFTEKIYTINDGIKEFDAEALRSALLTYTEKSEE